MWFRLFSNRKLFILLTSLVLLLLLMGVTGNGRTELSWPEKAFKSTLAKLQGLVYKPAGAVTDFIDDLAHMGTLYEENTKLRAKLEKQIDVTDERDDLRARQKELEKLVGYYEKHKQEHIVSQVVARSADRFNDVIVIDRGMADGIEPNMAVITHEGLIGRVESATDSMANVQLLTSSRQENLMKAPAIAAEIKERNAFGIIEGYDHDKKALILSMVDSQAKLNKGDTVITYGQSEIYPPNLLIGTVQEVGKGNYGLDQTAYVKPKASFDRLRYVMVVRDTGKLEVQKHLEENKADKRAKGGD